jgi:outer membrane protein
MLVGIFGRTIDPTRNEFISETFFNNSFSLNSNVLLYNAGKINNSIKQADVYNKAALKDLEQSKRDISLSIASLYLNILFAKENLQNTQNQLDQTKNQLTLLNKQIAVGNRPENDRLDIEAQIAVNEQSVTEATNTLNINLLNLKQWLRLDVQNEIDVVAPLSLNIGTDPDVITFDELYESAYRNQASLHASELKVKGAELAQKIASADLMPVLSAGGYLRTNYSNKGVFISGYEPYIAEQEILFNGTSATIGIPQQKPILEKSPYFDQFSDNLSYGIGIFDEYSNI